MENAIIIAVIGLNIVGWGGAAVAIVVAGISTLVGDGEGRSGGAMWFSGTRR